MTIDEKAAMMSARANPGVPRLDIGAIHFSEALHGLITSCVSEDLSMPDRVPGVDRHGSIL